MLLPLSPVFDPVLFVLDLYLKYTVEVAPLHSIQLYCMVCYRVIADPYKKCWCIFEHRYALDDNSEYPIDYEISLFPKVCLYHILNLSHAFPM